MVKNQQPGAEATEQFFRVEELQAKKKTPAAILSGTCTAFGWKPGKMVSEKEYDDAIGKFSKGLIGKKVN